jgi:hypothetical protein
MMERSDVPAWLPLMPWLPSSAMAAVTSSRLEMPIEAATGPMYFIDSPMSPRLMLRRWRPGEEVRDLRGISAAVSPIDLRKTR